LAKVVGDELRPVESLTRSGFTFGTPDYMSPEQARGQRSDHRSDVYSVGVMLYEMATGSRPFTARTTLALLTKQANEPPEPPRARAPDAAISAELEAIILRAMEKDPARRFQSMREMAEAIAALPVVTSTPETSPTLAAAPNQYRTLAIALAVLCGLLTLALVAVVAS
jgi:serine/threonine-protein kinase